MQFTIGTLETDDGIMLVREMGEEWEERTGTFNIKFKENASQAFVDGFVCLLLGNYRNEFLSEGNYPDLFDEVISRCWHFDTPLEQVWQDVPDRYVIDAKDFEYYGVYLATDNLEEFVSGMKTCREVFENNVPEEFDISQWSEYSVHTRGQQDTFPVSSINTNSNTENITVSSN